MLSVPTLSPPLILAGLIALAPMLAAGYSPRAFSRLRRLPLSAKILLPSLLLCVPYILVNQPAGSFQWGWLGTYLVLPIAVSLLVLHAATVDPTQLGVWPDYVVLATLGLAVDLRWFEPAWPQHMAVFNKILLLDLGIWDFALIRQLHHAGFDLRMRRHDIRDGLLNFALYTPIAIVLGLSLHFLHFHFELPDPVQAIGTYIFTFLFVAVPEELFFRGWMQNLLERRLGSTSALLVTSVIFGLTHFNKRAVHFNWRYVLLAAIAGLFYGRSWRIRRRVAASAITHATVDTVWSLWFR